MLAARRTLGNQSNIAPPAFAFISAATATTASATSITVNRPTNLTTNNLLVLLIDVESNVTINTPAGWTSLSQSTFVPPSCAAFYKTAASEPAAYTISFSAASVAGVIVANYGNGGHVPTSDAGTAVFGGGGGNIPLAPTVTPSGGQNADMWIACLGNAAATTLNSISNGLTLRASQVDAVNGVAVYLADKRLTSGAATGNGAFTLSGNDNSVTASMLFKPQ